MEDLPSATPAVAGFEPEDLYLPQFLLTTCQRTAPQFPVACLIELGDISLPDRIILLLLYSLVQAKSTMGKEME